MKWFLLNSLSSTLNLSKYYVNVFRGRVKNVLKEKEKHQSTYKRKNKNYIRFFLQKPCKAKSGVK